ncbi:MAG: ABC transporter ATP-binding protein [Proteobacteria bacterium]|nr:ABC transporter ATP-binding protein [Pseudomonadota bacterium]
MILFELEQVTSVFGGRTVLDIDSLKIEQGLIYTLLGPNGSGKTTLLNILGFLENPTAGRVRFENAEVAYSANNLQKLRRNIVMVAQQPILFTTSVYKNLEFGLKIRRIPGNNRRQIIADSLDLVGMSHMSQAPAHKLSGGETQRVVLARALALSPRVILCDEPVSSVDLENQIIIVNLLRQINEEKGITIILTSHDKSQIASLSHKSLFIDGGRISDAFYENLFSAEISGQKDGESICSIRGCVDLKLSSRPNGKKRIMLDPKKIDLLPNEKKEGEGEFLQGTITQVSQERDKIRVVVDSSIRLVLIISTDEYRAKRPTVGEPTHIAIRPDAIRFL